MNINELVAEGIPARDPAWFESKRDRAVLPKLRKIIDYTEDLLRQIHLGGRDAWLLGRYRNGVQLIETNLPE
ncbi:hypothetical protein SEA_RASPUTIA_67 [Microbacterium phage Rasputia]|nr:hypothetical protein SEA_RASPUTIA_67 [Microbacterium phage Rasputia]